ncbi:chymotrypsin-2-like [Fopius arisanus]|uniref:Chymotrypsin-2-like n=1 Tax=Fopius arisanus TaxID=64838 RepID=A0A9R1SY08_9HYME|nr:PREDICTED: chymotrypsin-2-like [Fopius arisanus]
MSYKRYEFWILYLAVFISVGYARAPAKIVGGKYVRRRECPHAVGLLTPKGDGCGGSILDKSHILTAAHCVTRENERFRSGFQIITNTTHWLYRFNVFQVSKIIVPKDFRSGQHNNICNLADIAVVKLVGEMPLDLMPDSQPISLPDKSTEADTSATICGWGRVRPNALELSAKLKKLRTRTIGLAECQRLLPNHVHAKHICAVNDVGQGICYGDSGASLVHGNQAIGIASWGRNCSDGTPQVFTNVYKYKDWIRKAIAWSDKSTDNPSGQLIFL